MKRKNTIALTPKEYHDSKYNSTGITYPAITKRLRKNMSLPNVVSVDSYSRFYILKVVA